MLRVKGKEIDFRVSSIPTIHGESMVLRILDKSSIVLDIERLGFLEDTMRGMREVINEPPRHRFGHRADRQREDHDPLLRPGEDQLPGQKRSSPWKTRSSTSCRGSTRSRSKPPIGLTFANALRSIVRQDPDVILIGEIRDAETAEIAIHSALTGHLVLSTLHTNDAPSAVTRLLDMGVEDFLLSSTMSGILAQRLVRVICPHCKEKDTSAISLEELSPFGFGADVDLYRGKGCDQCAHTGYRGRTGIYELLVVDDDIRRLILKNADASELRCAAIRLGMKTLLENGVAKVSKGITTLSEVFRVTQEA